MGSFSKATKAKSFLRCAVYGPSGSGKTFSCLRIATGLGGRIAVIDSERGSASKYSDRFSFDVCDLENKTINTYCEKIREAGAAGYQVLIIDSMSHAWQELLEQVEELAKTKYRGNTWSAWSEGTPKQRKFVDVILSFPGHVLATMRSKTEWQTTKDERGKNTPQRIGLAPEQGKGLEYDFDVLMEITPEHYATVIKDRSGKFQDIIIHKPGEDFGRELAAWLSDGEPMARERPPGEAAGPPRGRTATNGGHHPPGNGASGHQGALKETWAAFAARSLNEVNKDWAEELAREGHDPKSPALKEYYPLSDINRLLHSVCSTAIEKGVIELENTTKEGKPDVRDAAKARAAVEELFAHRPKGVTANVMEYFKKKKRDARIKLGMPDPDAEDEGMGGAQPVATDGAGDDSREG